MTNRLYDIMYGRGCGGPIGRGGAKCVYMYSCVSVDLVVEVLGVRRKIRE